MPFDNWCTPDYIIEKVRNAMGSIDLDPATHPAAQSIVKATNYYTIETNGLDKEWKGNIWLNPPYSRGNIDLFVDKAISEWNEKFNADKMCILVNSQTDTAWYHKLLNSADCVLLFRKRIKFWKIEGNEVHKRWKSSTTGKMTNAPRYLNSLFWFGNYDCYPFIQQFDNEGTIMQRMNT